MSKNIFVILEFGECFAENTAVRLHDGAPKLMRDLDVGDRVLVSKYSPDNNLKLISSPILTVFRHHCSSIRLLDIFTTDREHPIRLTPTHSLLVRKANANTEMFEFASQISVGDYLFSPSRKLQRVSKIKEIFLENSTVYAPLTFEGTIVTNHSIASCYGTYSHDFMHVLTIPVRWWYRALFELSNLQFLQKLTNNFLIQFIHGYVFLVDTTFSFA